MKYVKDVPVHLGYLIGLIFGISLVQEYGTVLISSVIVVDGEVNFLSVEFVIWFIYLNPMRYIQMKNLIIHSMVSSDDGTTYGNIYSLFVGMSLVG